MADAGLSRARRQFVLAALVGGLGLFSGCSVSGLMETGTGDGVDETALAVERVNRLRAGRGLSPLVPDRTAIAAALDQAKRMARAGRMAHEAALWPRFADRMKDQDVRLPAAENIAAGQADVSGAVDAWIASRRHLENMTGVGYTGLGVAVARDPASGNRPYWAMVLSSS